MDTFEMMREIANTDRVKLVELACNKRWHLCVSGGEMEFYRGDFYYEKLFNETADDPQTLIEAAYNKLVKKETA